MNDQSNLDFRSLEVGCKDGVMVEAARPKPPTITKPQFHAHSSTSTSQNMMDTMKLTTTRQPITDVKELNTHDEAHGTTSMEHLTIELPDLPNGPSSWVYTVREHPYSRMMSSRPWKTTSPESDLEKHLQILSTSELVTNVARYLVQQKYPRMPRGVLYGSRVEGWQTAAIIHRLVIHAPHWRAQLTQEYLSEGCRQVADETQRADTTTAAEKVPQEKQMPERLLRLSQLIDAATEQGKATFFSRRVLLAWHRVAVAKAKTRRQKMKDTAGQPSDGTVPKTATEDTNHNATAFTELPTRPWSDRASKVWFVRGQEVLCFVRGDSRTEKPQLDTFGGNMEEADKMSFAACARRELREEVRLERSWLDAAEHAYETSPNGHARYTLHCTLKQGRYQDKTVLVTHWFVSVPPSSKPVELTEEGERESIVGTLSWRTAKAVFENLNQFNFLKPLTQDFLGLVSTCGDRAGRFSRMTTLPAWTGGTTVALTQRLPSKTDVRYQPPVTTKPKGSPFGNGSPSDLPPLANLTPAAEDEFSRMVAMASEDTSPQRLDVERENEQLFDRILAEARRLAKQKGASSVSFRDVRQSAETLDKTYRKNTTVSPSEEQPEHIDEVVESLAALRTETLRISRGGKAPPRVLVVGETGSEESPPIVALMFKKAGAEVVTCDLKESTYKDIPHYCGDAAYIQDQGWDLVICHPPCTYLSNAGVTWLKDDPVRWQQLRQNASVFRMLYAAQAPFVAAENAKMHLHARRLIGDLRPSQYVHPWQHGHGHTKPTGLFLCNLPLLTPSREVEGRQNALANVTPSPDRAEKRSRTYPGIAAAMAIQWMPTLHKFCQHPTSPRNGLTAEQMMSRAKEVTTVRVQVLFVRESMNQQHEVLTLKGSPPTREGIGRDPLTTTVVIRALLSWLKEIQTPQEWQQALQAELEAYPDGRQCYYHTPGPQARFYKAKPSLTRVWVVAITDANKDGQTGLQSHGLQWTPFEALRSPWQSEPTQSALVQRYLRELKSAVRSDEDTRASILAAVSTVDQQLAQSYRRPWLVDYEDLPPPPPTPRHVRRRHGKWQVWTTINPKGKKDEADPELAGDKPGLRDVPEYGWQLLPPSVTDALNDHLGLPFRPMKRSPEGSENRVTWDDKSRYDNQRSWLLPYKPMKRHHEGPQRKVMRDDEGNRVDKQLVGHDTSHSAMAVVPKKTFEENSQAETLGSRLRRRVEAVTLTAESIEGALVDMRQNPSVWMKAQGGKDNPPLTEKSKLLWANRPLGRNEGLGLGAAADGIERGSEDDEDWPYNYPESQAEYIDFMRESHQRWKPAFVPPNRADQCYREWTRSCNRISNSTEMVAALTRSAGSDSMMTQDLDSEVTLTPSLGAYAASSLYVTEFRVARKAQTRQTDDELYSVDTAVAGRVLADTGAAPSIVTTELLEKLPRDCRLSRDPYASVGPLNGADGKPLVTLGRVKIDFYLGDTPCQHEFTVVQGKPLVLLGNDFLVPRNAEIHLNTDGRGNGRIELISNTQRGTTKEHSFNVSSNARRPNQLRPMAPVKGQDVANVDIPTGFDGTAKGTNRTGAEGVPERWMPEPKKPEDLTREACAEDGWRLETSEHLLYTDEAIAIPPRSRVTVRVRAPQQLLDQEGVPSCLVDRLRQGGYEADLQTPQVPPVVTRLTTIQDGYVYVQLVNVSNKKQAIAGLSPLAMLDSEYYVRGSLELDNSSPEQQEHDPVKLLTKEQVKMIDQVTVDPANRLSDAQKARVRRLLAENVSAFAADPKNPTKTHLLEVELPLKPNVVPHRHAASRVGEEGRQIIEKHIEEMESRGIIRKSNSAWGSRVVLVTKKDGSIRFCVDYRDLNAKLQLQDSPIPLTVEALDRLSSGTGCQTSLFLSTLDLASGFWTLPIREADKSLTAFVTHRQKYEFNYLPFGIQSGPSYMVRLMDAALQGLAWETCMPYLDDVGVWSTGMGNNLQEREDASFEQMMTRLQAVFERLRWAGLSMKASKCILFGVEAEYLGHIVSREGLKMDPKKVETVRNWDTKNMNTVTKVRSFLGMCSYYRRFIEGFSRVAAPLTDLTKDGVDVERESQTPQCRRAMQILIKAITGEPVMSTPRFDRPFIVKTDAANKEGLGGVLSQLDDEGKEKVIAYHGRRLNKHERNYTVTEIECLAAIDSIKHWRPYLWGRVFKLVVDHSALRWLHTMRDTMEGGPASRLMRWILKLSEYRFHVEHKPGALHKDADAISRLVMDDEPTPPPQELPSTVAAVKIKRKTNATTTARSRQAEARSNQTTTEVQLSYLDTGSPTMEQLKVEQENDPECVEIMDYLSGRLDDVMDDKGLKRLAKLVRTTTSGTHNQRKAVHAPRGRLGEDLRIIKRMAVRDGILYRFTHQRTESSDQSEDPTEVRNSDQWVPLVPAKLRSLLITAFHDRMGHASRDRVYGAMRKRYYWPKMGQDIETHVAECHECTLAKYPTTRSRDPVGPPVGRFPFDIIYTDVLDLANTHDYTPEGAGHRKLVVFADSLSRWVEAVPLHKDPTAAEFMNLYHEHVVARYGVPRALVCDRGSNLVAELNEKILKSMGTELRATTAEHKEANGVVERFNQTLQNMVRASNEGGGNWRDHLPFLLMAYRATPHRVTRESPAMILFGRELRLPAQVGQYDPPPSTLLHQGVSKEVREYATRLHNRMVYAWRAAYEASREAQGSQVSDTTAHALRGHRVYKVNDRVARRLYGAANALSYKYAGPYRVVEVKGNGRYRVQDLENRGIYDEFDVSNLRPYLTRTDEEALTPDEYIVDKLLNRRVVRGEKSYLVKYLGYAKKFALWTPRAELERRCEELLEEYDAKYPLPKKLPKEKKPPRPKRVNPIPFPMEQTEPVRTPEEGPEQLESHLPNQARLSMGEWSYGREVRTRKPKGTKVIWKDSSHFTTEELASEKFCFMREQAKADAENDRDLAAVFNQAVEYYHLNPTAGLFHDLTPSHIREEQVDEYASMVWFITNENIMCFESTNDNREQPRLETYGGQLEPSDEGSFSACALRRLREQILLPTTWSESLNRAVLLDPKGQACVKVMSRDLNAKPKTAIWFVRLTEAEAAESPTLTQSGGIEVVPGSMRWYTHGEVLSNLSTFVRTHQLLINVMKKELLSYSTRL